MALVLSEILGGPRITLGALRDVSLYSGKFFIRKASILAYLIAFFNFNFLALVVSEILGDPKFTLEGLRALTPPSGEIFVR